MTNSENIISQVLQALILVAITVFVFGYIDDLNTDNYIISAKWLLKGVALSLIILLFSMTLYIIHKRNKRKNFKKYTETQIKIAKDILNGNIQNTNDFLLLPDYFNTKFRDSPVTKSDKNRNLIFLNEPDKIQSLLSDFKNIMADLIKYDYIKLETDTSIELFTYIIIPDKNNNNELIFHDMKTALKDDFEQKNFIVTNPTKLKKLIRLKSLPEQNQNKGQI